MNPGGRRTLGSALFVTRRERNVLLQRRYSHPVDKDTGVSSDQTVIPTSFASASMREAVTPQKW